MAPVRSITLLASIEKARGFDIKTIVLPHIGLLNKDKTAFYLDNIASVAKDTASSIANILLSGGTKDDAMQYFKNRFYRGSIPEMYPPDAMELNTSIMISLIEREIVKKTAKG